MRFRTPKLLAIALLLIAFLATTGCRSKSLETVSDAGGLFHVRIPADWKANPQRGLMVVYADDKLPASEDEAFKTLSVGVFVSQGEQNGDLGGQLTGMLKDRAEDRDWTSEKFGQPRETTVGKRSAVSVDVSAVDAQKRPFQGRATLVRTSGSEVLIFAVAPKERWKQSTDDVDRLLKEWYWHLPPSTEDTASASQ